MKIISFLLFILIPFQIEAQFCTPTYNPDPAVYVHNFNIGDIVNRNSGHDDDAYIYYPESEFSTELEIGRSYPFTASTINSAGIKADFAVWIDYDNDSTFTMDERVHYVENVNHYTASMLNIPNDLSIVGKRRLRISYVWTSADLEPCGDYNVGETEDYDITFVSESLDQVYYCMPFDALGTDNFFIDTLIFGDISNLGSKSNMYNYIVYTDQDFPSQFLYGTSYDFYASKENLEEFDGVLTVWIDYNDNQIFEEQEIVAQAGPDAVAVQKTIDIPLATSILGLKRMRVRAHWNGDLPQDPCGFDSGTETEDYYINIVTEITTTNSFENDFKMTVFPNPAVNQIFIKNQNITNYQYKVRDALGKTMIEGKAKNQSIVELSIENLTAGFHTVEITHGRMKQYLKFIKK